MEKIKFTNLDTVYNCNLTFIKNNVIKIIFDDVFPSEDAVLSGFSLLNEHNLDVMSDYSNYTTKYKDSDEDKTIYLSTGEIYSDSPISDGTNKIPEKELTEEEKEALAKAELEQVKKNKIIEMNTACKLAIENGISVNDKQYSYTIQDQSNMLNAMNLAKETGLTVPYHANGEPCSLYSYEEIATIYMQAQMNLTMNQTYFNQLKLYIESIVDTDEIVNVNAITWGTELSGKYLVKYNEIIEQSNKIMQKLISLENTDNGKETV